MKEFFAYLIGIGILVALVIGIVQLKEYRTESRHASCVGSFQELEATAQAAISSSDPQRQVLRDILTSKTETEDRRRAALAGIEDDAQMRGVVKVLDEIKSLCDAYYKVR